MAWNALNPIAAKAQQLLSNFVFTELELGITFLEVATTTADRSRARESINNAINALRTADKYLSQIERGNLDVDAVRERRDELAQSLRRISGVVASRTKPLT